MADVFAIRLYERNVDAVKEVPLIRPMAVIAAIEPSSV